MMRKFVSRKVHEECKETKMENNILPSCTLYSLFSLCKTLNISIVKYR